MSPGGGSVIDYFIIHRKLAAWCQEASVYKEGYSAPHKPVELLIKGQQVTGRIEVHKRPPALREPMGHGPFRNFDDRLAAAVHEVTTFMNKVGVVADD